MNGLYLRSPYYMSSEGMNMPLRMESVLEKISFMYIQSICRAYALHIESLYSVRVKGSPC